MKETRFYDLVIFLGVVGSSFICSQIALNFYPEADRFSVFGAFFFPAITLWARLRKKELDTQILENKMTSQDSIHSQQILKLNNYLENQALKIEQLIKVNSICSNIDRNTESIEELSSWAESKGFQKRHKNHNKW